MDADLCRKLAIVKTSPFYFSWIDMQPDVEQASQQLNDLCVRANTEESLPDATKEFFQVCDRSIEIAKQKGFRYPYTQSQIEQVMEAMENGN